MGVLMRAGERPSAPVKTGTSELQISAVRSGSCRLFEADVAGDGRQAKHPHVRRRQRHHDRDRVVGGGVGVDEEIAHGVRPSP